MIITIKQHSEEEEEKTNNENHFYWLLRAYTLHRISLIFVIASLLCVYSLFMSKWHTHTGTLDEEKSTQKKWNEINLYSVSSNLFGVVCLFVCCSFLITGMGRSVAWNVFDLKLILTITTCCYRKFMNSSMRTRRRRKKKKNRWILINLRGKREVSVGEKWSLDHMHMNIARGILRRRANVICIIIIRFGITTGSILR